MGKIMAFPTNVEWPKCFSVAGSSPETHSRADTVPAFRSSCIWWKEDMERNIGVNSGKGRKRERRGGKL